MADANQILFQAKQFWASRTRNQRIVLGGGAVATIAVIAFFGNLMSGANYQPLVGGLEPADAQTLSADLTAKKIPFQLSPDGKSISVPADQIDAARLDVASNQSTHSGRLGFEIFDKVSWGQTEFDEKVNYQRALEGELERTIMTLGGVKSARVHLVMATESVFLDRDRSAKGSVTLKLGTGGLSREETMSIQRLVSGAVEGLKPTDVAIIDADSNEQLGPTGDSFPGEEGAERQLTERLMATLAPVVGKDHLRASVNIEYDPGTTEENQEKYDPTVSAPLSLQTSEERSGDASVAGGVPGTASNIPTPGSAGKPASSNEDGSTTQTSKTQNATYGVNKTMLHTLEPAGRIKRITAALIVDDEVTRKTAMSGKVLVTRVKRTPAELKQIEVLAQNAIGLDSTRGDVISVQNLAFDTPPEVDVPPVTALDRARRGLTEYSSFVRYGGLLLLFALAYMLMIKPIQKRMIAGITEMPKQPLLPQPDAVLELPSHNSEGSRTLALKQAIIRQVMAEPIEGARVVQTWMRGEA
jgi:flagellar M-ring protein FliF